MNGPVSHLSQARVSCDLAQTASEVQVDILAGPSQAKIASLILLIMA